MAEGAPLRWPLAGTDPQASLFPGTVEVEPRRGLPSVEYLHVNARTIISEVPAASRMPFRFTINAYRGCSHACTYCFARPTHEYLGLGGGEDFERRLVVKVNAVERLRAELADPRWGADHIAMGTNTDPYQPCEGRYRLTRGVIGELIAARNAFSILTKSTMILRDLDLLAEAVRHVPVRASFSIGTLDEHVWRISEPGTPPPRRRVEAVARLVEAGIPCGVLIAPVLPGLSDGDEQLAEVVRACVEAGASSISSILLHLRPGVRELYLPWLESVRPDLVSRYAELYSRGGYLPRAMQDAHAARVRDLVERFGGRSTSPRSSRGIGPDARSRQAAKAAEPPPGGEQLRLVS